MNKKGDLSVGLGIIVAAIVLLIAGGGILYASQKGMSSFGKGFSAEELRLNQNACLTKGIVNPQLLTNDNDKYPNSCDVCPWCDSSIDADADYMPDCCDKDPDNSRIFECISGMDREKFQCKKPAVQAVGGSQPQRETAERQNAEAREKYELALAYINQKDYTTAYSLIKNVLLNYRGTAVYNDAVMQFQSFDVFFENNSQQLLQFYRDALQIGLREYEQKIALYYKTKILDAIKISPEAGEAIAQQFETESEAFTLWDERTEDIASEIYYKLARTFLEKNKKDRALYYFNKTFSDYPDAFYANGARTVYNQLTGTTPESTTAEEQPTVEEYLIIALRSYNNDVINAGIRGDVTKIENELLPAFESQLEIYTVEVPNPRIVELTAEVYYHIAEAFQHNNKTEKALYYYRKVFTDYPDTYLAQPAKEEYDYILA